MRGLHLQQEPFAQGKLVRVLSGKILDVAVDCRLDSNTLGKHVSVELSSENKLQLWIPKGFAHGFQVLSQTCYEYQVDARYAPEYELSIDCFDPELNIGWDKSLPIEMSKKDKMATSFQTIHNKYLKKSSSFSVRLVKKERLQHAYSTLYVLADNLVELIGSTNTWACLREFLFHF